MRAYVYVEKSICRCLVVELCLTLCNPMDCSTPGFLVLHHLPEFAQTQSTESVMPCNLLIFCFPFLLSPSIFPSIRVFSSQSALHIRWPKDWSFSFSINASDEYSGLISFRTKWFDLLQNGLVGSPCSPRDSQESSPTPQFKSINSSSALSLLHSPTLTSIHDHWKNLSFDYPDFCWQSDVSFLIQCLGLS